MRSSVVFLFSIILLSLTVPGILSSVHGEGDEQLRAVVAKEDVDDQVIVTVRIISTNNNGHISVLVRNGDNDVVLLETVELSDGYAQLGFRVDRDDDGDYTVFLSGVDSEGEKMDQTSATFVIQPNPETFELFGFDGWLVILVIGSLVIVGIVAGRSYRKKGSRNTKKGILLGPELTRPQMKKTKEISEPETSSFQRPLTGTQQKPEVFQPIKQEIHHHYAPQYDQSQQTENIIDSVYYRKKS